ncbi:MAG: metallophosphoesterase family protein [Spirochaetales bacterium]|nr:metallophosphoesterase family protein [Spirochaetales bacterium]
MKIKSRRIVAIMVSLILCSGLFIACVSKGESGVKEAPAAELIETAPVDGSQIVFWFEAEQIIVGTELNLDQRFVGIESSVNEKKLPVYEGSAVFEVQYDSENDLYSFVCDGKYLTSTTANIVSLADASDENGCSKWKLLANDNGWLLINAAASYNEQDIYFEYYKTGFTTYNYYDSSAPAYTFNFYKFNGFAPDPKLNWAEQNEPSSIVAAASVDASNNSAVISGTSTEMEYKTVSAREWTNCSGSEIEGLIPGEYEIRYAERDGYKASNSVKVNVPFFASTKYIVNDLTMQPGADETQMNFCWYSNNAEAAVVEIALKSAMTDSNFPEDNALTFSGTATASGSFISNEVVVEGLKEKTEYIYRVGDGDNFGAVYDLKTQDSSNFNAILVGDPQIGCSGNTNNDMQGWENTISTAIKSFPNSSFILSAGDQVETGPSEAQYDAFFNAPELVSTPLAPTIGNHDNKGLYKYHYNSPNESTEYGTTKAGSDYYFTYGNTLFMVINSNNTSAFSHETFMKDAIEKEGINVAWKIVMFHHSIYSSATHSVDADIIARRNDLYPVFDKLDIDVVLMGHDHVYSRSWQLLNGTAQKDQKNDADGNAIDPTGTLYVTVNSSSGSKYYDLVDTDKDYRAARWQGYEPSYSNVEITDNSFTVTTYKSGDNSIIDTCSIYKTVN